MRNNTLLAAALIAVGLVSCHTTHDITLKADISGTIMVGVEEETLDKVFAYLEGKGDEQTVDRIKARKTDVQELKNAGVVEENTDGYLDVRETAQGGANVRLAKTAERLVARENADREKLYAAIAGVVKREMAGPDTSGLSEELAPAAAATGEDAFIQEVGRAIAYKRRLREETGEWKKAPPADSTGGNSQLRKESRPTR